MSPRKLDIDATLTIDAPGGRLTLAGRGRSVDLEVGGLPSWRSPGSLLGLGRRHAGKVAEALDAAGLTLFITRSGRRIASLGAGTRESKLMMLFGIRGIQLHYGALLKTGP